MSPLQFAWSLLLLKLAFGNNIPGLPANLGIDCKTPTPYTFPAIFEENKGDLEVSQIPAGAQLALNSANCPIHDYLTLSIQDKEATVKAIKPLDAETLCNGTITYYIDCTKTGVRNERILLLMDINDNSPVFEKKVYTSHVLQGLAVGDLVIKVQATDADISPVYNALNYSMEPPSDTFDVKKEDGSVILRKQLNSLTSFYNMSVKATDIDGNMDIATVLVFVRDPSAPYFEHEIYSAVVPEQHVGPVQHISPGPLKAHHGSVADHQTMTYSISEVDPKELSSHFTISRDTGDICVSKQLSHQQAAQGKITILVSAENEKEKTANATLLVSVNSPPSFNAKMYSAEIFTGVAPGYPVVKVMATDPDETHTAALVYSLFDPSFSFAVEPFSGQVYVVTTVISGKITLNVTVEDPLGLSDSATVKINIADSGKNHAEISLNLAYSTLIENCVEMQQALEKSLGWAVKILEIRSGDTRIHLSVNQNSAPLTYVKFLALAQGGTVIMSKDKVEEKLATEREEVLNELKAVFGPDVDFDIVIDKQTDIFPILLGTLIPLALIAAIIVGVFMVRRRKEDIPDHVRKDSMDDMPGF